MTDKIRNMYIKETGGQEEKDKKAEIKEKDSAVDAVFDNPQIESYTSISFKMEEYEGRKLIPGKKLVFVIPKEFRGRIVRDIVLRHRKGEAGRDLIEHKGGSEFGWDPHGAYSRVEVHDIKADKDRQWRDPAGYSSDKFAEPRHAGDPEVEALHDWIATVGKVNADRVSVTNVGKHPTYSASMIHGLEIVFFPELEDVKYNERIYCPGTSFVQVENPNKLLPQYGGGEHTSGKYNKAVVLGHDGNRKFEVNKNPGEGARKEGSSLFLKLEPGKQLVQFEAAIGDTEYYGPSQKSRLGWAKLWVGVKKAKTGEIDWFIKHANIPPQGVISGAPHKEKSLIEEGDELVIQSRADTSYLMGWRVAYKDKDKK